MALHYESGVIFSRTVKHSWQKLGAELHKLADLHAEKVPSVDVSQSLCSGVLVCYPPLPVLKARTYVDAVRKPLFEVLPQLEEARRVVRGV